MLPPEGVYATAEQIKTLDALAVSKFHCTTYLLMEKAGEAIAEKIAEAYPEKSIRFVVFSGKGNNGGDGVVIARELNSKGYRVELWILARHFSEMSETAATHLQDSELQKEIVHFFQDQDGLEMIKSLSEADVAIDALLGISLKGEPLGHYRKCIEEMNLSDTEVIAIDLPSGIDADQGLISETYIRAQKTYTLAAKKRCMSHAEVLKACGQVELVDIGIPEAAITEVFHL